MIMEDPETTADSLREIKGMGLAISVDDFGTGYSSLSVLKRFPLDELKIDCSFVNGIPTNANDCVIVTAIVQMAHTLGLTVVAEGVETAAQLAFLEERGCEEYQGYLFSKPLAAKDWAALFASEGSDGFLP